MSNDAVHPDPTTGPASPVVPPRRDLEALSLLSTDHHLARTAEVLAERFAGVFSRETVAACLDACPIFPGKRYLDRELTDPAGEGIDDVRRVRDDIDRHVRELLTELVPARTM